MYNNKKFLAIIPARSGSKGLKDKNIKLLNDKPLISYTIEAAKKSGIFDYIIVSTDSSNYASISRQYGAEIPFLRSEELSSDTASSTDVIIDVINRLEKLDIKFDFFVLLQPTSPLRNEDDIRSATELLFAKSADSIVSVCESEYSPELMNILDESYNLTNFISKNENKRRQDLSKYYRLNGAIYICDTKYFKKNKDFYGPKSYAYIMEKFNSVDIDEQLDFIIAESLIKYKGTM